MTPARIAIVLLAAGQSRRMLGQDKLLRQIQGQTLLARAALAACDSLAAEIVVVLPVLDHPRTEVLAGLRCNITAASAKDNGMADSLKQGVLACSSDIDGVIIGLADMPEITADDYNTLIAAFGQTTHPQIFRAVAANGAPGNPVLFSHHFFAQLLQMQGDVGAKPLLADAAQTVTDVPLPDGHALIDLDSPADWAAYGY